MSGYMTSHTVDQQVRIMATRRSTAHANVRRYRERMRAEGLRQIQP
jgi:hypothetical protein